MLIIRGGADGFVTEQMIAAIGPRFANAEMDVVDDGGHWVHVEYPESVASRILEFSRAVPALTQRRPA